MSKENGVVVKFKMAQAQMDSSLDGTTKKLKNLGNEVGLFGQKVPKAFSTKSISGWIMVAKEAFDTMMQMSSAQSQYIEDLNMMDIAFGDTNKSARSFVDSLSDMIGFDQSTLTKQLGTYRQMASALNIDSESADTLSKNLLKLQLDTSSLYGISLERSAEIFQSTMGGNTKSIRALGGDITEASLQQQLYNMGLDKSVSSLNRASKEVLIYLTVEQQLSNAQGDTSRTINSVSNQTKIFEEQIKKAGRQIGGFFIPILQSLLPILNGILMVFNAITSMILGSLGISAEDIADQFGTASSDASDLSDSLDDVSESAKAAKGSLRGFDKLNVITTPTSTSTSSSKGSTSTVDPELLSKLKDYNMQLDKMQSKAADVRDRIMEWLGFTKDVNSETGEITWTFNNISGIDFSSLNDSWNNFVQSLSDFNDSVIMEGLKWFYDNILMPLATYTVNDLLPAFFDNMSAAIDTLTTIINIAKDPIIWMWDNFFKPIAEITGWLIIGAINSLTEALKAFSQWCNDNQDIVKYVTDMVIAFVLFLAGSKIVDAIKAMKDFAKLGLLNLTNSFNSLNIKMAITVATLATLIWGIQQIVENWDKMTGLEKVISIMGAAAIAAATLAAAVGALQSAWSLGIAAAAIVAGVIAISASIAQAKRDTEASYAVQGYATGGFPKESQIFFAREDGKPEMVGSIGNKTAVANNGQIVDGIASGVAQAMMAVGNKETNVNIVAQGDTQGLLDFINFKQAQKDRAYGL